MSILIKGLTKEKVESCFRFAKDGWCIFDMPEIIEVPPHGRLIDADALKEKMKIVTRTAVQEIVEYDINAYKVDDAPTIIESEDE